MLINCVMQRFLEQDEVVLDVNTGLMWTKNACLSDFPMTWNEALTFIEELNHFQVFKTGQINCYGENGDIVDCNNTGQDGEFQSGLQSDQPRFIEDIYTIYDSAANLTWLKIANYLNDMLDWKSAFDLIEKMNREYKYGHNDWRLPSIIELERLRRTLFQTFPAFAVSTIAFSA